MLALSLIQAILECVPYSFRWFLYEQMNLKGFKRHQKQFSVQKEALPRAIITKAMQPNNSGLVFSFGPHNMCPSKF